jgi:CRP/FNR family cyclic AMP-dependent transcriptional regulator
MVAAMERQTDHLAPFENGWCGFRPRGRQSGAWTGADCITEGHRSGVSGAVQRPLPLAGHDENELVVDFDDHDNDVYFIASGIVRALYRGPSGREVILGELRDGDLFGELAAIDEVGRSANVTALCRTELGKMSGEVFREMVTGHPEVSLLVMRILTERVRALNIRLTEHSMLNSRERLYAELLRLSEARKADPKQRSISPPPVQQDLANRIGCRREVVSREIACLRRDGILQSTKGALILIEPSELNRRISAAMNQE